MDFSLGTSNIHYDYCSREKSGAYNCCEDSIVDVVIDSLPNYCCVYCDIPEPPPNTPL